MAASKTVFSREAIISVTQGTIIRHEPFLAEELIWQ
jgi:hypothetical protein